MEQKNSIMLYNDLNSVEQLEYNKVAIVVESIRLIKYRLSALVNAGFFVCQKAMGNGGCGHVKKINNTIYQQVSCGYGKYNYAWCVIL